MPIEASLKKAVAALREADIPFLLAGSLAVWARDSGATGACLEVEAANAPARALYAGFGLAELYRYHYRREPHREPPGC